MNNVSDSITADIDGTHYAFNVINASTFFIGLQNTTTFSAESVFVSDSSYIELNFISKVGFNIEPQTYGIPNDNSDTYMIFQPAMSLQQFQSLPNADSAHSFVITVTAVSDSTVQGTFQGNIYLQSDSTLASKVVSNGKFYISQ